jgi:DNA-binding NarL/FixJ family response regulator
MSLRSGNGKNGKPARPTRVMVVDDHQSAIYAVRRALGCHSDMEFGGSATTGDEALRVAATLKPDVAVVDMRLDDMEGADLIRQLRRALPGIKVVAFSGYCGYHLVREALDSGACAFVCKRDSISELTTAVRQARQQHSYYSPTIERQFVEQAAGENGDQEHLLSAAELEIVKRLCDGQTTSEIADEFGLSESAVAKQRQRAMKKLRVANLADLVKYAIREGITTP